MEFSSFRHEQVKKKMDFTKMSKDELNDYAAKKGYKGITHYDSKIVMIEKIKEQEPKVRVAPETKKESLLRRIKNPESLLSFFQMRQEIISFIEEEE